MAVMTMPILGLASLQRELAAGRKLPPVEGWNPAHCGELDIRIAHDGTWLHEGQPIARRELVRLFSTILRRDGDSYYLITPVEKMRITVEDVPFLAVLLDVRGSGRDQQLVFTTNVGDEVVSGHDNPIRVMMRNGNEPVPYLHVRHGLEARISRNVYYQLAEIAVPNESVEADMLGVWSSGVLFPLGPAT